MKERGMTGGGGPQITGVPRVHLYLKLAHSTHGRGTIGNDIFLGQSSGIPLTPLTMIHGSTVMGEAK